MSNIDNLLFEIETLKAEIRTLRNAAVIANERAERAEEKTARFIDDFAEKFCQDNECQHAKNAGRYRWLRKRVYKDGGELHCQGPNVDDYAFGDSGEALDLRIDEEIAKESCATSSS